MGRHSERCRKFRKVRETKNRNQHLSEFPAGPSEFPSPFGMCCEVPGNFSAGRLNRGKYECTDEAARTMAAVRTI